jgi:mxaA protein
MMISQYLSTRLLKLSLLSLLWLSAFSFSAIADDAPSPPISENAVKLTFINPERHAGYLMGDLLDRTVTLEVKKPYKLVETTLPIVGYEHRYKGQVSGIELRKISHSHQEDRNSTTYTINLSYQVFTTAPVVKPAILPTETIKFQGPIKKDAKGKVTDDGLVQFSIPAFYFRISPMAVFGAVKVEEDLSPLRKPFLLQPYPEKQKLVACLIVLGLSLIGLLYILGSRAWLPLMGKPFAQASRQLRRLNKKHNEAHLKLAISCVHHAINETAQSSVFSDNIDALLKNAPGFTTIQTELKQFFALSNQVFFDDQQAANPAQSMQWLITFCKQCRDCERGLKPARNKAKA